ncbi:response regulator transcription factor [Campylobacter sp. faydin G-24]|uniref:Response regulator transcription factor n=1 Tax=Campylobacter anatolicus TaxID=2829105 RepID=A0ABS5HFR0_9BACT|nr:response regulator transcription factor [Campylobacter anatolicus]MBR8462436.1 response regulator transcription factor [Campylobacter anatolicus]MBR8463114.1 response regulator transcription factor [Campylobacter anatolicus]MBR8465564.1 response regulator transcription factor [Campylobacter anatolicus]
MNKILIVEDEAMLLDMMTSYLKSEKYDVIGTKSYNEALNLAYENNFDLWIFDVKIIGGSGFGLLRELREAGRGTPCIFTTSLNTIKDVQDGFLSGCDDYIKKPFELKELLLRVNNILKRTFIHNVNEREILGGGLSFDMKQNVLFNGENSVAMPKKQAKLLALLLKNRDKFISRDEIYSEIWEYSESPSELSLRVYIAELRKILGKERIVSASKLGYKYA